MANMHLLLIIELLLEVLYNLDMGISVFGCIFFETFVFVFRVRVPNFVFVFIDNIHLRECPSERAIADYGADSLRQVLQGTSSVYLSNIIVDLSWTLSGTP